MDRIPTPNSFQAPRRCEGACEEHRGPVYQVEVKCDGHPNGTWGEFWYCQEAIEEDRRRGLNPVILEKNTGLDYNESTELSALREDIKRFEAAFVRIAKAHGLDSPLMLVAMAENNEENYAEILARYIEQSRLS